MYITIESLSEKLKMCIVVLGIAVIIIYFTIITRIYFYNFIFFFFDVPVLQHYKPSL